MGVEITAVEEMRDDLLKMYSASERLKTFESWPNDVGGKCTPEKLAEAGFIFQPCDESPDNVCCIFCWKELDGWEPDDDPMQEHKKHSKICPFITKPQPFLMENLTLKETMEFLKIVTLQHFDIMLKKKDKEFQDLAESTEKTLWSLILGKQG